MIALISQYSSALVRHVGRAVLQIVWALGQESLMLGAVLKACWYNRPRHRVVILQLYHIGFLSLPVVILSGLSIGLVLAVQGYSTLSKFNAENVTGAMVNFSMVTQLAPVVVGLMLAGRVGSAIAAEIGAMKVTEQIDALRIMGTDPISYLVVPRFVACVMLMPLLTAIGAWAGVTGAEMLAVHVWQIDPAAYRAKVVEFVGAWDVLTGLLKTVLFGAIIALVACRKGLMTRGGATGVGASCTEGVVTASVLILVSNFVVTLVLERLYALLID